jgi:hypothetical protein
MEEVCAGECCGKSERNCEKKTDIESLRHQEHCSGLEIGVTQPRNRLLAAIIGSWPRALNALAATRILRAPRVMARGRGLRFAFATGAPFRRHPFACSRFQRPRFRCHQLRPSGHQYGFLCSTGPRPCVFRSLLLRLLAISPPDLGQNSVALADPP